MVDISKILLAETSSEILEFTQTTNLTDAENITINDYESSMRTGKPLLSRIILGVAGSFFLYISPLFFVFFPLGICFLYFAFFFKIMGRKQVRKKFATLRMTTKSLDSYPELMVEKSIATFIPRSALGSQASRISDIGQLFRNTDVRKHLWNHAGYCSVAIRSYANGRVDRKHYYMYAYQFHGAVPQTVMVHAQDHFSLPISPDNKILTDICPPWQTTVAEQYEIESLTILTQDVILKLTELAKKNRPVTIEFFESKLFCFIPVDVPNITELISLEKTADNFAQVLLPRLEGSQVSIIGNIQPVLALDIEPEEDEENTLLTPSDKVRQRWILFAIFLYIPLLIIGIATLDSGLFSPKFVLATPVALVILIIFIMPKKLRSQWLKGSGLRINGNKVNIRRQQVK